MNLSLDHAGLRIDGRWLLRDVSFTIEPASVTAVVGPNGCGKSTALRMLAGLWKPTVGSATLDGVPLGSLSRRDIARQVAYVPQDTHIGFAFTVEEVVAMGRHAHTSRFESPSATDAAAVDAAMRRTDVAHLAARPVNEISGGERQRVLIARSLATEARTILLDEPTASLDVDHALETLRLLRQLAAEGEAIAVSLHDLNSVLRWADRALLLAEGRVTAWGAVGDVLQDRRIESVFGVNVQRLAAPGGPEALVFHPRLKTDPGPPPEA